MQVFDNRNFSCNNSSPSTSLSSSPSGGGLLFSPEDADMLLLACCCDSFCCWCSCCCCNLEYGAATQRSPLTAARRTSTSEFCDAPCANVSTNEDTHARPPMKGACWRTEDAAAKRFSDRANITSIAKASPNRIQQGKYSRDEGAKHVQKQNAFHGPFWPTMHHAPRPFSAPSHHYSYHPLLRSFLLTWSTTTRIRQA